MITVLDIIRAFERRVPSTLAAPWDHVGLQVGDINAPVRGVYTALDPTEAIVKKAIETGATLLITHHPLYIKAPARFDFSSGVGRVIALALEHKLSIYAAHTNLDAVKGGLNDILTEKLGLTDCRPLETIAPLSSTFKLIIYTPGSHRDAVLNAVFSAGAGHIGNYSDCAYSSEGTGRFRPLSGSRPFIGKTNQVETVSESRLEVIVPAHARTSVEQALRAAHPYEEPAFDWIALSPSAIACEGIGRIGTWSRPRTVKDAILHIKKTLGVSSFRWIGPKTGKIARVAVCSGSGASLIPLVVKSGADLYLSGDIKYHDALDADDSNLKIADLGHFATEHWAIDLLRQIVQEELRTLGFSAIPVYRDHIGKDPFTIV